MDFTLDPAGALPQGPVTVAQSMLVTSSHPFDQQFLHPPLLPPLLPLEGPLYKYNDYMIMTYD